MIYSILSKKLSPDFHNVKIKESPYIRAYSVFPDHTKPILFQNQIRKRSYYGHGHRFSDYQLFNLLQQTKLIIPHHSEVRLYVLNLLPNTRTYGCTLYGAYVNQKEMNNRSSYDHHKSNIHKHVFLPMPRSSNQCKLNTTGLIPRIHHTINNATIASVIRARVKMRKWTDLIRYGYALSLKRYTECCLLFVGCYACTMYSLSRSYSID
jgi:hypothetical protein